MVIYLDNYDDIDQIKKRSLDSNNVLNKVLTIEEVADLEDIEEDEKSEKAYNHFIFVAYTSKLEI